MSHNLITQETSRELLKAVLSHIDRARTHWQSLKDDPRCTVVERERARADLYLAQKNLALLEGPIRTLVFPSPSIPHPANAAKSREFDRYAANAANAANAASHHDGIQKAFQKAFESLCEAHSLSHERDKQTIKSLLDYLTYCRNCVSSDENK